MSLILTLICLSVMYDDISLTSFVGKLQFCSLYLNPSCHTLSNAFSTSSRMAAASQPLFNARLICSVNLIRCSIPSE